VTSRRKRASIDAGKRRWPTALIAIAVMLGLLGLYSFSTGYRFGSDMAKAEGRN